MQTIITAQLPPLSFWQGLPFTKKVTPPSELCRRKYVRQLPHICRVMGIELPLPFPIEIKSKGIDTGGCAYFYGERERINISIQQITTEVPTLAYFQRLRETTFLIYGFRIDWELFVLAHELAHYKQRIEGRLKMVTDKVSVWDGKFINSDRYPLHYHIPYEADANDRALRAMIQMHIEGVL